MMIQRCLLDLNPAHQLESKSARFCDNDEKLPAGLSVHGNDLIILKYAQNEL